MKFDILLDFRNTDIQKILREIERCDLAISLKNENEEIKEIIFGNMSKMAAAILKDEMRYMGNIYEGDIIKAQEKILSIISYLIDTGEIALKSEGEEYDS